MKSKTASPLGRGPTRFTRPTKHEIQTHLCQGRDLRKKICGDAAWPVASNEEPQGDCCASTAPAKASIKDNIPSTSGVKSGAQQPKDKEEESIPSHTRSVTFSDHIDISTAQRSVEETILATESGGQVTGRPTKAPKLGKQLLHVLGKVGEKLFITEDSIREKANKKIAEHLDQELNKEEAAMYYMLLSYRELRDQLPTEKIDSQIAYEQDKFLTELMGKLRFDAPLTEEERKMAMDDAVELMHKTRALIMPRLSPAEAHNSQLLLAATNTICTLNANRLECATDSVSRSTLPCIFAQLLEKPKNWDPYLRACMLAASEIRQQRVVDPPALFKTPIDPDEEELFDYEYAAAINEAIKYTIPCKAPHLTEGVNGVLVPSLTRSMCTMCGEFIMPRDTAGPQRIVGMLLHWIMGRAYGHLAADVGSLHPVQPICDHRRAGVRKPSNHPLTFAVLIRCVAQNMLQFRIGAGSGNALMYHIGMPDVARALPKGDEVAQLCVTIRETMLDVYSGLSSAAIAYSAEEIVQHNRLSSEKKQAAIDQAAQQATLATVDPRVLDGHQMQLLIDREEAVTQGEKDQSVGTMLEKQLLEGEAHLRKELESCERELVKARSEAAQYINPQVRKGPLTTVTQLTLAKSKIEAAQAENSTAMTVLRNLFHCRNAIQPFLLETPAQFDLMQPQEAAITYLSHWQTQNAVDAIHNSDDQIAMGLSADRRRKTSAEPEVRAAYKQSSSSSGSSNSWGTSQRQPDGSGSSSSTGSSTSHSTSSQEYSSAKTYHQHQQQTFLRAEQLVKSMGNSKSRMLGFIHSQRNNAPMLQAIKQAVPKIVKIAMSLVIDYHTKAHKINDPEVRIELRKRLLGVMRRTPAGSVNGQFVHTCLDSSNHSVLSSEIKPFFSALCLNFSGPADNGALEAAAAGWNQYMHSLNGNTTFSVDNSHRSVTQEVFDANGHLNERRTVLCPHASFECVRYEHAPIQRASWTYFLPRDRLWQATAEGQELNSQGAGMFTANSIVTKYSSLFSDDLTRRLIESTLAKLSRGLRVSGTYSAWQLLRFAVSHDPAPTYLGVVGDALPVVSAQLSSTSRAFTVHWAHMSVKRYAQATAQGRYTVGGTTRKLNSHCVAEVVQGLDAASRVSHQARMLYTLYSSELLTITAENAEGQPPYTSTLLDGLRATHLVANAHFRDQDVYTVDPRSHEITQYVMPEDDDAAQIARAELAIPMPSYTYIFVDPGLGNDAPIDFGVTTYMASNEPIHPRYRMTATALQFLQATGRGEDHGPTHVPLSQTMHGLLAVCTNTSQQGKVGVLHEQAGDGPPHVDTQSDPGYWVQPWASMGIALSDDTMCGAEEFPNQHLPTRLEYYTPRALLGAMEVAVANLQLAWDAYQMSWDPTPDEAIGRGLACNGHSQVLSTKCGYLYSAGGAMLSIWAYDQQLLLTSEPSRTVTALKNKYKRAETFNPSTDIMKMKHDHQGLFNALEFKLGNEYAVGDLTTLATAVNSNSLAAQITDERIHWYDDNNQEVALPFVSYPFWESTPERGWRRTEVPTCIVPQNLAGYTIKVLKLRNTDSPITDGKVPLRAWVLKDMPVCAPPAFERTPVAPLCPGSVMHFFSRLSEPAKEEETPSQEIVEQGKKREEQGVEAAAAAPTVLPVSGLAADAVTGAEAATSAPDPVL